MTTPRLRIESLSKSFFGVRVLHDVSFDAYAGEVLGLVGENGSGKSTTMNILAGVLPRDTGTVQLDGAPYAPPDRRASDAAGVAFIQQELNVFPNLSVGDNLFLGRFPKWAQALPFISAAQIRARARTLLEAVGLDVDSGAPAGTLSAGEQQLLEIARALSTDARVIIFDEPTTSLTHREATRLWDIIGRLKANGVAVIYISHALEDVLRLSDRLVVMRDGRVTLQTQNVAVTADDLVVAMVGRSIEALFPTRASWEASASSLEASPGTAPLAGARLSERSGHVDGAGSAAVTGRSMVLAVEGVGEPGVVENITFSVNRGEILGLSGLMGAGRSELARILFGLDPHSRGSITINGGPLAPGDIRARLAAGVAFLTEDRRDEGLMMDATVADNMALAALPNFAPRPGYIEQERLDEAMHALAKQLNLKSGPIGSVAVRTLSGGNQQKVVLGRWLLRSPALFILDEPTRGVDVGAKEEIYRLLVRMADEGMAILVISSELEELMGLCDRILVMRQGHLQADFARQQFDRELLLKAAFGQEQAA